MARRQILVRGGLALILLVLITSLLGGTGLGAEFQPKPGDRVIVSGIDPEWLPVLPEPGVPDSPLLALAEGNEVVIEQGPHWVQRIPWYEISGFGAPGELGWVDGSYLRPVEESLSEDPVEEETDRTVSSRGGLRPVDSRIATVTAYSINGRTRTGAYTHWGIVAVDPRVIPLGTKIQIEGFEEVFVAADTGSAVRGNWVDIWFPSYAEARRFGTQARRITILEP